MGILTSRLSKIYIAPLLTIFQAMNFFVFKKQKYVLTQKSRSPIRVRDFYHLLVDIFAQDSTFRPVPSWRSLRSAPWHLLRT